MQFPVSSSVQFFPASGKLFVDDLVDPSGAPLDVLDIDLGFTVRGHIELPGWLSGEGVVRLLADELGGPLDEEINHVDVPIPGATSATDPDTMTYSWEIAVGEPTRLEESKLYHFSITFLFQTPGRGHTDIAAFCEIGMYLVV